MIRNPPKPKTHGFSHGLNIHQILSYILVLSKVTLFQFYIVNHFLPPVQVLFSVLYYSSTIVTCISALVATLVDPTDEVVLMERKARENGEPFDSARYDLQCEICEASVSNNTKHCRSCNRCVDGFDHHCEWVNNCISRKNYKAFAFLIGSLACSLFFFLLSSLLYLIDYRTSKVNLLKDSDYHRTEIWKILLVCAATVLFMAFFMLDLRLISFHVYLYQNKMTTYDYIVRAREAKLQKLSQRRSSLLNRRPGLNRGNNDANQDLEGNESHAQLEKSKSSRRRIKFWENIPFAKLLLMGNNEEADPGSKESKSDQSNSSPPDTNHRTTDKRHSPFTNDRKNGPIYDFENKHGSEITDQEMHLRGSPMSGNSSPTTQNNFLGVPNISSPNNYVTSSRSSMQELVFDDRREDDEHDEKRGETFESRFVAISLAKIVTNYVPKYGQIIEEENESERPTGTEVTGRSYRVNL